MAGVYETLFNTMSADAGLVAVPGIVQRFGRAFLRLEDSPTRVTWCPPQRETFGPPGGYAGDQLNQPRVTDTRLCAVEAHIWNADGTWSNGVFTVNPSATIQSHYSATETLLLTVSQALRRQFWPGYFYKSQSVDWIDNNGDVEQFGMGCILTILLSASMTMPETQFTEQTITQLPITTVRVDPSTGALELNV
jgi:hypothetical protein